MAITASRADAPPAPPPKFGAHIFLWVERWSDDGAARLLDLLVGNFYSINSPGGGKAGGNVWLFLGR